LLLRYHTAVAAIAADAGCGAVRVTAALDEEEAPFSGR
jgi:hypothetical protein